MERDTETQRHSERQRDKRERVLEVSIVRREHGSHPPPPVKHDPPPLSHALALTWYVCSLIARRIASVSLALPQKHAHRFTQTQTHRHTQRERESHTSVPESLRYA
eukprot:2780025-Rhodomonas_salina.1